MNRQPQTIHEQQSHHPVDVKLLLHEQVCVSRYNVIIDKFESGEKRMTRQDRILMLIIVAVLFGPGVAAEFVKKLIGL